MKDQVHLQSVAVIRARPEQNCLPEVGHDRQVPRQIDAGDVGEDRSDKRVGEGCPIERGDQLLDVVPIDQVLHEIEDTRIERNGVVFIA